MNGKFRNIRLTLSFDGTAYHGWQVQKNAQTVQQVLQDALEAVLKVRPDVTGCSRTDAGVHANEYICNFRTESNIPTENLTRAINVNLPPDICVRKATEEDPSFHARYSSKGKEYIYQIWNREIRDPFFYRYSLHYPYRLDMEAMQKAADAFVGRHDFASFCATGGSVIDTVRQITLFEVEERHPLVIIRVRADGFLYNMVRILTGTLLSVSQSKIRSSDVAAIIRARDRSLAGPTVPAKGLFLNRVFYTEVLT